MEYHRREITPVAIKTPKCKLENNVEDVMESRAANFLGGKFSFTNTQHTVVY